MKARTKRRVYEAKLRARSGNCLVQSCKTIFGKVGASGATGQLITSHHITSHGEDGCRPQWPLYPRNNYLYTTLLLHK